MSNILLFPLESYPHRRNNHNNNIDKAHEIFPKIVFFSDIGKRRLSRIYEESYLEKEVIFTGFPRRNEAQMRERVGDYVQRYLIQRSRSMISRRNYSTYFFPSLISILSQSSKFMDYEEFVEEEFKDRRKLREWEEIDRINTLLMLGEMKCVPEGFEGVLADPIYGIRKMKERILQMQTFFKEKYTN